MKLTDLEVLKSLNLTDFSLVCIAVLSILGAGTVFLLSFDREFLIAANGIVTLLTVIGLGFISFASCFFVSLERLPKKFIKNGYTIETSKKILPIAALTQISTLSLYLFITIGTSLFWPEKYTLFFNSKAPELMVGFVLYLIFVNIIWNFLSALGFWLFGFITNSNTN